MGLLNAIAFANAYDDTPEEFEAFPQQEAERLAIERRDLEEDLTDTLLQRQQQIENVVRGLFQEVEVMGAQFLQNEAGMITQMQQTVADLHHVNNVLQEQVHHSRALSKSNQRQVSQCREQSELYQYILKKSAVYSFQKPIAELGRRAALTASKVKESS